MIFCQNHTSAFKKFAFRTSQEVFSDMPDENKNAIIIKNAAFKFFKKLRLTLQIAFYSLIEH